MLSPCLNKLFGYQLVIMFVIKTNKETQIIRYLISGDIRGKKLLRKYYAPSLYGMMIRMRSCPNQSMEILESALNKIYSDISSFTDNNIGFFTWVMQVGRKLAIAYGAVSLSPIELSNHRKDTVYSLVMHRGFSLLQAAAVLKISAQQVAMNIRKGLKESALN